MWQSSSSPATEKVTALPEPPPVATSVCAASPEVLAGIAVKLIYCEALVIAIVLS